MAGLALGSSDRLQATPATCTDATARVTMLTSAKLKLGSEANIVFCCSARMTSTELTSPALAPSTGGLLAHIWPELGLVQPGVAVGQINDWKVNLFCAAVFAARPQ